MRATATCAVGILRLIGEVRAVSTVGVRNQPHLRCWRPDSKPKRYSKVGGGDVDGVPVMAWGAGSITKSDHTAHWAIVPRRRMS